jgi:predicted nicotinamide N-methyase
MLPASIVRLVRAGVPVEATTAALHRALGRGKIRVLGAAGDGNNLARARPRAPRLADGDAPADADGDAPADVDGTGLDVDVDAALAALLELHRAVQLEREAAASDARNASRDEGRDVTALADMPAASLDMPVALSAVTLHGATAAVELLVAVNAAPGREAVRKASQCDLWAYLWPAGVVLADIALFLCQRRVVADARVLELGAGAGLPSLVAWWCGDAAAVVASDIVPDALALLAHNARRMMSGDAFPSSPCHSDDAARRPPPSSLSFSALSWNRGGDGVPEGQRGSFSLVLGADILFLESSVPLVLACVAAALSPRCGVAVLTDPGRPSAAAVLRFADAAGLRVCAHHTVVGARVSHVPLACANVFVLALLTAADDDTAGVADAVSDAVAQWRRRDT